MKKEQNDWTKEELMEKIIDKVTPVTVPVNIAIHGKQTILNLSRVEDILRNAEIITLGECGCRSKYHKCDGPIDVCLSLDAQARESMERGAKRISLAQALVTLKRSHEAGLVHMAYTFKGNEKPDVICSCCSCCCHSLSALVRFGIPDHVVASEYIAENNNETCGNCGTCTERCQFHARQLVDEKLAFNQSKCFGCGLCLTTCPTKSIKLVTRSTVKVV
jgi:NAD-dependent dihydropyrimidine dehydrogenase PreA subunit